MGAWLYRTGWARGQTVTAVLMGSIGPCFAKGPWFDEIGGPLDWVLDSGQ